MSSLAMLQPKAALEESFDGHLAMRAIAMTSFSWYVLVTGVHFFLEVDQQVIIIKEALLFQSQIPNLF